MDDDSECVVISKQSENITITLPYRGPGYDCVLRSDLDVVEVRAPTAEELEKYNENVNAYIAAHFPKLGKIEAKVVFGKVVEKEQDK